MKNPAMSVCIAAMLLAAPSFSQNQNNGQGQAIVTVLPKHEGELPPSVVNQDLSVKVNGKVAKVTKWMPLNRPENSVELVLLIDGSARSSLGTQLEEMARFVKALPPNTKAAIAYMENGRAAFLSAYSGPRAGAEGTSHARRLSRLRRQPLLLPLQPGATLAF